MRDKPKVVRNDVESGTVFSINPTLGPSAGSWRNHGVWPRQALVETQLYDVPASLQARNHRCRSTGEPVDGRGEVA